MKLYFFVFLTAIMTISCNNSNKSNLENTIAAKNNLENTIVEKSNLIVPFPDIQIPKTSFLISNERDTVLSYKTGTKIRIPKNAFLDKEGIPVKGDVKLIYREFTNPFDIYLGGIPMVYNDSTGIEQVFETAGMLEINAFSEGQSVFPNPQNKVQIQMISFQKGNEFNVYHLDTISGKWNYLGKDEVVVDNYDKSIASLPQVPPIPKRAGEFSFSIGDDTGDYSGLNIYENVLFEPVDNKPCGFGSTEIKAKDLGNGIFEVTFKIDAYGINREESCKCYLAFEEGVDYDNAMKVYQNKYKSLIKKREKIKQEIEMQWKSYLDIKQKYADLGLLDLFFLEYTNLSGEEKVTRTLEINGFGFINCDFPTAYPQGAELLAKHKDKQGNEIILNNIVLVEKGRNAIFRYTSKIKFNPQQENMIWGVTNDNKLAYLKANEFKEISQTQGEYTFIMNVHEEPLKTYEDICEVLF